MGGQLSGRPFGRLFLCMEPMIFTLTMTFRFKSMTTGLLAGVGLALASGCVVAQDAEAGRAKVQACAACHGPDGNSASGQFPNLAGQNWRYIYMQLKDFQEGRRADPVMSAMAAPLSRQDMIDIGNFYAAQKPKPSTFVADENKIERGKAKANETLCSMCHLGEFAGQNEIPRVAGQQYDYVVKQLRDFKARKRTNDAGNMTSVAQTLGEADIENLAHYITSIR
jgi:cytochrome c553